MTRDPVTREEAAKKPYRVWGGNPTGNPHDPTRCAAQVADSGRSCLFHQCIRKPGHGPDDLYCKQHAKGFTSDIEVQP